MPPLRAPVDSAHRRPEGMPSVSAVCVEDWPQAVSDTGCHVQPSCLNCGLPQCIYDDPRYDDEGHLKAYAARIQTAQELLLAGQGSIAKAAAEMGLSRRTIYRLRSKA